MKTRSRLWAALSLGVIVVSCVEGGLNQNERSAGNGDGGVSVGFGEIAIDPTGTYLLSSGDGRLVYGELSTGAARVVPHVTAPQRVAFDHEGQSIFVTRALSDLSGELSRVHLTTGQRQWSRDTALGVSFVDGEGFGSFPWLDVLEDDSAVVLTYADRIELIDAQTGERRFASSSFKTPVIDIDITPDQTHAIVTTEHVWEGALPTTVLHLVDLTTFRQKRMTVPNCSDELVIEPSGRYAFLAPTTCQRDPVSVIDLERGTFVRNLPGFGPVALAPGGELAVAFLDALNVDATLFDDEADIPDPEGERYHLMLIDTKTLAFDVIALGYTLPRYAVSPDGTMLLVDAPGYWDDGRIRVLDVASRALTAVKGPGVRLDNYVVTRDSAKVFLLYEGLYRMLLKEKTVQAELIDFTPTHLNITPDDRLLVLREDDSTLWLYDVEQGRLLRPMALAAD